MILQALMPFWVIKQMLTGILRTNKKNTYPLWWITLIKNDPMFNSIRNEERFQKIVRNMESKYIAEHERVRKWLEEQGSL